MKQKLEICRICKNREFNQKIGLICGLTNNKPDFIDTCSSFSKDENEAVRILQLKLDGAGNIESEKGKSPKWLKNMGIFSVVVGIVVSVAGTAFSFGAYIIIAYGAVVNGILMIVKSKKQQKILQETAELEKKLSAYN